MPGEALVTKIGNLELKGWDPAKYGAALKETGYPAKADSSQVNWVMAELILLLMVIYVTMVYGPIAAFLVELFPTRIRYTSMSLPRTSAAGSADNTMLPPRGDQGRNIYYGLWYPIVVSIMTVVIGTLFLRETKDRRSHIEE